MDGRKGGKAGGNGWEAKNVSKVKCLSRKEEEKKERKEKKESEKGTKLTGTKVLKSEQSKRCRWGTGFSLWGGNAQEYVTRHGRWII